MHTYAHKHPLKQSHTRVQTRAHPYVHAQARTYVHTHAQIYIRTDIKRHTITRCSILPASISNAHTYTLNLKVSSIKIVRLQKYSRLHTQVCVCVRVCACVHEKESVYVRGSEQEKGHVCTHIQIHMCVHVYIP